MALRLVHRQARWASAGAIVAAALAVLAAVSCGRQEDLIVGRLISASPGGSSSGGIAEGGAGSGGELPGVDAGVFGGAGGQAAGDAGVAGAGGSSMQACGDGTGPCPVDEYCSFDGVDACGDNAALGHCVQRPTVCPFECVSPMLCACNGQRYCNECLARAAGFDVGPDGVCQARHCGSWLGIGCSDSEFCDYGGESTCGTAAVGNCLVRPTMCSDICDPVCACDGLEYCNECQAHLMGGVDRATRCP